MGGVLYIDVKTANVTGGSDASRGHSEASFETIRTSGIPRFCVSFSDKRNLQKGTVK